MKYAYIALVFSLLAYHVWACKDQYRAGERDTELFYQKKFAEESKAAQKRLQAAQSESIRSNQKYMEAVANEAARDTELNDTKQALRLARRPNDCANDNRNEPDYSIYRMYNAAADSPDLPPGDYLKRPDSAADGLDAIQTSARETIEARLYAISLIDIIEAGRMNGCYKVVD